MGCMDLTVEVRATFDVMRRVMSIDDCYALMRVHVTGKKPRSLVNMRVALDVKMNKHVTSADATIAEFVITARMPDAEAVNYLLLFVE